MIIKAQEISNKKGKYFSDLTKKDIQDAFDFQQKNQIWTFYNEREFQDNSLLNRFNCLLVMYSLFILAFFEVQKGLDKIIVLSLGFIITSLVSITIFRTFSALKISANFLDDLEEKHVCPFIRKELIARKNKLLLSNIPIIGIIIPVFFVFSFLIALILIITNVWVVI